MAATEGEQLVAAAEYRRAFTETDLIARVGFNDIADRRKAGEDFGWGLNRQIDRFLQALEVEETALERMRAARHAA